MYLSIDPGYEKLGYCIFKIDKNYNHRFHLITSGLIKTKREAIENRLVIIYEKLKEIIDRYSIKKIIVEEIFFFKNQKTIVKVSMIHGLLGLLAGQNDIEFCYLSPLEIKEAITGYGRADKKGVRKMLLQQLDLDLKNKEDDEIDAIAGGLTYALKDSVSITEKP